MKSRKKIGSLTAYSMMVATVVGIGIFLKNSTVFRQTGYNPISTIIAWLISAIVCLFLAVSYADISTTSKSRAGISKWAEKIGGYKLSFFIKTNYSFFYFGSLMIGLGYYAAEFVMKNLEVFFPNIMNDGFGKHSSIGLTLSIGTMIMMLFIIFNYFSLKLSGAFQITSLILKFIPLLSVAIFGVVFVLKYGNDFSLFSKLTNVSNYDATQAASATNMAPISINAIIVAIPGILFAFDSFLGVGSLAPDVKKSEKRMPLIFIIGMISIAFIYISITFGQIFVGEGVSWNAFKIDILKKLGVDDANAAKISGIVTKIFYVLILFSVLGVCNGFSAVAINVYSDQIEHAEIFGATRLLKWARGNSKLAGLYLMGLLGLFWSVPYWSLSFVYNTDFFIDGLTNFPTLFFFLIYGLIPLLSTIQKIKYRFKFTFKNIFYGFFSLVSFIFCCFIVFYQVGYFFLWHALTHAGQKTDSGWGGFLATTPTYEIKSEIISIIFFSQLIFFIFIPLFNRWMINYGIWSKNKKYYNLQMVRSDVPELSLITKKQKIIDQLNRLSNSKMTSVDHEQSEILANLLEKERAKRIKREKYLAKIQETNLNSVYKPKIFR